MSTDDPVFSHDASEQGWTPARSGIVFNVVVTAIDVGVAILAFQVARNLGASDAVAYVVGSVGPILGSIAVWVRARKVSGASLAILAFTLLSALAVFIGSRRPDMLLYKDAVVTGIIGLIFAGSVLLPRPLVFYFGQRYATDGTHDGMERYSSLWQYRTFRRANQVISLVWGAAYLGEAGVKAWVISRTSFGTAYVWDQVLPWIATGVAFVITIRLGRYYRRRGMLERQAAAAAPA